MMLDSHKRLLSSTFFIKAHLHNGLQEILPDSAIAYCASETMYVHCCPKIQVCSLSDAFQIYQRPIDCGNAQWFAERKPQIRINI